MMAFCGYDHDGVFFPTEKKPEYLRYLSKTPPLSGPLLLGHHALLAHAPANVPGTAMGHANGHGTKPRRMV